MTNLGMGWTTERVTLLKRLWAEGHSCSQIARQLGGGCTRNAVIGKIHRLGFSGRVTPARLVKTAHAYKAPKKQRAKPRLVNTVAPVALCVALLDLTPTMCRWPTGGEDQHLFCGHERMEGSAYCPHHSALSWSGRTLLPVKPPFEKVRKQPQTIGPYMGIAA